MKELINDIRNHIREEYNLKSYLFVFFFTATAIFLNYHFNFEPMYLERKFGHPICMLYYSLFDIFPYFFTLIPILYFKKKTALLKSREFWIKSLIFLTLFGVMAGFSYHIKLIQIFVKNPYDSNFLMRIFSNLKRFIPFILVLFFVKIIFDRKNRNFYGLRYNGLNYRPFLILLLLILPLAAWASFQKDFQNTYPIFKFWNVLSAYGLNPKQMSLIFETTYGIDFISVELLFRGALVIGLASVLGVETILPMAVTYVFIHFGKPAGETISSFFGGYILGVIALYRKNISAGIIIHVGLAYMMETAAVLQHFYNR
jgi:hypothetical protein